MAKLLTLTATVSDTYKNTAEALNEVNLSNKFIVRKTLVELMKQSFFHGSNKFGNNFIA